MGAVDSNVELPLDSVGERLARARAGLGLTLGDVAARTKIPERQLIAIEAGQFSAMAARTYAIGFARSYARAVGLDPDDIANAVRAEMAAGAVGEEPRLAPPAFEPGDPARVPSAPLAWIAAALAAVLALSGLGYWFSGSGVGSSLPSILPNAAPAARPSAPSKQPAPAALPTSGPVVFTALADGVWVKFSDGAGKQLMQKQMARGESYTVPADVAAPVLWTGRPQQLAITIGGHGLPKLSEVEATMKDVPVSAVALLAREAKPAAPASAVPSAAVSAPATPAPARHPLRRAHPAARPSASPTVAVSPAAAPAVPAAPAASGAAPAKASTVSP